MMSQPLLLINHQKSSQQQKRKPQEQRIHGHASSKFNKDATTDALTQNDWSGTDSIGTTPAFDASTKCYYEVNMISR